MSARQKTWADYLMIAIIVVVVIAGLAALAFVAFFSLAMSQLGSNK